jgi:hypothetical protein
MKAGIPDLVVHKDEFVFNKKATQRAGVGNLYRLMDYLESGSVKSLMPANNNMPGFADGGYVGNFSTPQIKMPDSSVRSQLPEDSSKYGGIHVTVGVDKKGNLRGWVDNRISAAEERQNAAMRESRKGEAARVAGYNADSKSRGRRPMSG